MPSSRACAGWVTAQQLMKKYTCYCFAILCLCLCFVQGQAQQQGRRNKRAATSRQKPAQQNPFFNQQWWIGIRGGLTAGQALAGERYAVFEPLRGVSANSYDKQYLTHDFSKPATTVGLIASYTFWRNFSVSVQPTSTKLSFGYQTTYLWEDEGSNSIQLKQTHRFNSTYLELPLLLRYDLYKARIRPYVQAGAYYGRLLKADKHMEVESLDIASGAVNPITNTAPSIGAKELFIKSNMGWLVSGGFNYDLGNVRLGLEINYKKGFENVTNRKNRFSDNRMVGVGDVMDDMKLQSWEAAFTLLFPLKFLDTGAFQSAKP